MMYHHSNVPYAIAAEQCSHTIRAKFERQIEDGKAQAQHTIKMLQENPPKENLIWCNDMVFDVDPDTNQVKLHDRNKPDNVLTMHRNAVSQAVSAEGVKIPKRYLDVLIEDGQHDLARDNLNGRFNNLPPMEKLKKLRRFNARSVNNQARCLVSDAFAMWDTNRLVESFISSVTGVGGVIIAAKYTELQFAFKAVLPALFEPVVGEVMLFGVGLKRSDFGLSPLKLEGVCNRPWCTNLATMESAYTKRNISARADDSGVISRETIEKQTEAHASAIKDHVDRYLSEEFIGLQVHAVHEAANTEINSIDEALDGLRGKNKITVKEAESVKTYYESKDKEMLPAGQTAWRLSNALSLLAQQAEPDRGLELEEVAGEIAGLKSARERKQEMN